MPPASFIFGSLWASVAGFSFFAMRLTSLFWALIALFSIYSVSETLSGDKKTALLSSGFMACNYVFIQSSADIRMDMMCMALMLAALAVYLRFRDRTFFASVLAAESLVLLSGLTHPHGLISFIVLHIFILGLDTKKISIRLFMAVTGIYLAGGLLWLAYILPGYDIFRAQFFANVTGRYSGTGLFSLVITELQQRYFEMFGLKAGSGLAAKIKIYAFVCYIFFFIAFPFTSSFRKQKEMKLIYLALLAVLCFLTFQPNKAQFYLVTPLPFIAIAGAVVCMELAGRGSRFLLISAVGLFMAVQLLSSFNVLVKNEFRKSFLPVADLVRTLSPEKVAASSEFDFATDFDGRVKDDPSLGFFSGRVPDMVIIDKRYKDLMENDTGNIREYKQKLISGMRQTFSNNLYTIYVK
ncbi:MAG: ArnT family glycosyltransferase [Deferribacterales bacterium]